ncbi:TauD/TfdA family dioxygenase [Ramlibacter sp. AW1]|uniref:TauD/TfdA family dioxygenase n=1 Tax=Ramlibacter aurantiacus TaxID=2801330 RepID=A0A936ZMU8_9BURK|nr:TauD/TfdA family dioxygenase [Ramlibacter aurantiacus]MBL0422657.1 TauD/TfdA family dioxygenase [Ramlibacter aurantiacus]
MNTSHDIVTGPTDWRGPEMKSRTDWIHHFQPSELAEIDAALATVRARGKTLETMTGEDFPLPTVGSVLRKAREFLEDGAGLYLLRGFPAVQYDKAALRTIYWGLGKHMGTAVSQSSNGDILGDVRNMNVDMNSPKGRGYTSNQKLTYHTDSCDVVGLFVLRTARAGGLSMIASSVAVHNEIARIRPDLLEVLYQPFYWSWQGQEEPGTPPFYPQPVFTRHQGKFSCRYVRTHIISAQRFDEVPRLTPMQEEAMALFDSLAGSDAFHFSMMFQPGDIQFLNNHVTVHSRTAFEDHDEPERKRHLLRMWLSVPNSRELSPALHTIYRDPAGGAVRGGFPSRTGRYIYETVGSLE